MAKEKRIVRMAKKGKPIRQVAAIPFRLNDDGNIEVLLITSNTTKRFIVPKGWPMKGKSGKRTARIEAEEEAGVTGKMRKTPLGTYEYWKRLTSRFVNIKVTVFCCRSRMCCRSGRKAPGGIGPGLHPRMPRR